MRHSESVEPSFPLTLTLSLGEREQPQRGACFACTAMANSVAGMAQRRRTILPLPRGEYEFSVLAAPVAQTCSPSVSVQIVAGRDELAERGAVSRSTLITTHARDLSKRWTAGKAPAGHRPALLWLRLRRAGLYRRFLTCHMPPASNVPPITNRRYGRLNICATVNTNRAESRGEGNEHGVYPTVP